VLAPVGLLTLAGSLMVLAACTADTMLDPNLEGTASITVLDANTNQPVDGVTLEFVGGPDKKTSSVGQATFENLRAGAYLVRLSKNGFESSQEPLTITTSGTEKVVAVNVTQTYRLHRKGPAIKGRILMRPLNVSDTTATVAADSVWVELRLTASGTGSGSTTYLAPVRTVKTSATGTYSFDSIPEFSTYALVVPEFSRGGKTFSQASANVASGTLIGSQQYTHPNSVLSPAPLGQLQVFARSANLITDQGWVFEFSSAVDTARIGAQAVLLRTATVSVNSTRTWTDNFTVLTIRPATGTWSAATAYSVVFTGIRDTQNRVLATTTITANTTP
jgi:hypothetical protein